MILLGIFTGFVITLALGMINLDIIFYWFTIPALFTIPAIFAVSFGFWGYKRNILDNSNSINNKGILLRKTSSLLIVILTTLAIIFMGLITLWIFMTGGLLF